MTWKFSGSVRTKRVLQLFPDDKERVGTFFKRRLRNAIVWCDPLPRADDDTVWKHVEACKCIDRLSCLDLFWKLATVVLIALFAIRNAILLNDAFFGLSSLSKSRICDGAGALRLAMRVWIR